MSELQEPMFRQDNTDGYTDADLAELNRLFETRVVLFGLKEIGLGKAFQQGIAEEVERQFLVDNQERFLQEHPEKFDWRLDQGGD